jgi:nucleotide-binding universal stress UspA family protein
MKRILVGVDGSATSLKAVELAADLAKKCSAQLTLLTVVPRSPPAVDRAVDPTFEEYARIEHIQDPPEEFVVAAAEKVLDRARRAAAAKGATPIEAGPAFGDPAREIIAEAEDRNADLVVVGSRGHGRLAGLLLGSVAQKLVSHAPCPVLVVR